MGVQSWMLLQLRGNLPVTYADHPKILGTHPLSRFFRLNHIPASTESSSSSCRQYKLAVLITWSSTSVFPDVKDFFILLVKWGVWFSICFPLATSLLVNQRHPESGTEAGCLQRRMLCRLPKPNGCTHTVRYNPELTLTLGLCLGEWWSALWFGQLVFKWHGSKGYQMFWTLNVAIGFHSNTQECSLTWFHFTCFLWR